MKKRRARILTLPLLAISALILLAGCMNTDVADYSGEGTNMEVYCFSAGKADSFLITTENSAVLIDTGLKGFGGDVLEYLKQKGIEKIDYLIITHFDKDHVGGAAKIINSICVDNVLQNNSPKDSSAYTKYLSAVSNAAITPVTVTETYCFELDGVGYVIDASGSEKYKDKTSNNCSLIVSVLNGENKLLFAGDIESERICEFIDSNSTRYDLLKVPHHGVYDAFTGFLIESVGPRYAVITSSDEEPESDETIAALEGAGVQVFTTRTAPVKVESDGVSISVRYE